MVIANKLDKHPMSICTRQMNLIMLGLQDCYPIYNQINKIKQPAVYYSASHLNKKHSNTSRCIRESDPIVTVSAIANCLVSNSFSRSVRRKGPVRYIWWQVKLEKRPYLADKQQQAAPPLLIKPLQTKRQIVCKKSKEIRKKEKFLH